jgi:tRNA U54 and U55 pseudouridine synthase Pus10
VAVLIILGFPLGYGILEIRYASRMVRYRLRAPLVGVEHSSVGMLIKRIESGEILSIPETGREDGLIEIVYKGRNVVIVIEDLRERAECLDARLVCCWACHFS